MNCWWRIWNGHTEIEGLVKSFPSIPVEKSGTISLLVKWFSWGLWDSSRNGRIISLIMASSSDAEPRDAEPWSYLTSPFGRKSCDAECIGCFSLFRREAERGKDEEDPELVSCDTVAKTVTSCGFFRVCNFGLNLFWFDDLFWWFVQFFTFLSVNHTIRRGHSESTHKNPFCSLNMSVKKIDS